jgi:aspartate-semialdehyde dehydrogenase
MSSSEAVGVVQVGATGVVAETFRDVISRPDVPFRLEAIATASHTEFHNKKLGETRLECPPGLEDVPITGVVSAIENADAPVFFSGMRPEMAARYEKNMAKAGRLVVTNASANRMEEGVALVSAFVNPGHIDELFGHTAEDVEGIEVPKAKIIAGGNCMAAIMVPALAPIHRGIGIESMSVRTLQGWSGAGARELPKDTDDSTQPIEGDEADKIQTEPNKFLGDSIGLPEDIFIGATPSRAPWLRGHQAEIALTLSRETSKQEIEELLRHFEATDELKDVRQELRGISHSGGDKWPRRHGPINPVKLEHGGLIRTDLSRRRLDRIQPMRVHAHVVSFDPMDPHRIVLEVSGDNLMQGAVGGNLLNAAYAHVKGYV